MTHTVAPRPWPVIVVALSAAVAIWSGWVELGRMTGFGVVRLLPGIWDDFQVNTAITLPLGMEAYAAYALSVWLSPSPVAPKARIFARNSALGALLLGASGQITYHLLAAYGVHQAPWQVTAVVACLPVGVLALAASLAHLLRPGVPAPVPTPEPERSAIPAQTERAVERTVEFPRVEPGRPGGAGFLPAVSFRSGPGVPVGPGQTSRTDEEIIRAINEMTRRNGGAVPSIYAVKTQLGIGSTRATRLLDRVAS